MEIGTDGNSESLTVDSAAPVFEGLLSALEEPQSRETPPTQDESAPVETEAASEQAEGTDEPAENENPDEKAEGEDQASEETPLDLSRKVKRKIDGEEVEITLEEALNGYSRTADYTRKTQAHAEKVKAFETEAQAVRAERATYATSLKQLEDAIKQATPAEPDWDKLKLEADPAEFASTWVSWKQHKERMDALRQEREQAEQKVEQDRLEARRAHLETERNRVLEVIPDWKDTAKASAEKAEMVKFALDAGYTEADLAEVTDHRVLVLLRKAMLYDKAQKAAPVVRRKIEEAKVVRPGASGDNKLTVTETTRKLQRLAKTGHISDAAAAFESML
jgi:hypothetical protein